MAAILAELKTPASASIVIEHQTRFVFASATRSPCSPRASSSRSGTAAEVRNDARVREVYLGQ